MLVVLNMTYKFNLNINQISEIISFIQFYKYNLI
jgi:hypothetical protein